MREVALDTETTGLDPDRGDRVVEIGCVELRHRVPTGRVYHRYLNPERAMPEEARRIHGLDDAFLAPQPVFAAIAGDFLAFIGAAPLVIHNAVFDLGFLNAELARVNLAPLAAGRVVDTYMLARRKFPDASNSLDALCRRLGVDNSDRTMHGALLDARLLAEVYLELMGGRQSGFAFAPGADDPGAAPGVCGARQSLGPADPVPGRAAVRPKPLAPRLTAQEAAAHEAFVQTLGAAQGELALWRQVSRTAARRTR